MASGSALQALNNAISLVTTAVQQVVSVSESHDGEATPRENDTR